MRHEIRTASGMAHVDMYCGHPDRTNNSTESIGCGGSCESCEFGMAKMTIEDFFKMVPHPAK